MTKLEKQCKDMGDVCSLAHDRTVRDLRKLNKGRKRPYNLDCKSVKDCQDEGQEHDDVDMTHYGRMAQEIFNRHYDHITNVTGL